MSNPRIESQPALMTIMPSANELMSDERGLVKISFFIAAEAPRTKGAKRKITRRIQYNTYRDNHKETLTVELRGSELGLLYDGDRDKWKAFLRMVAEIKARVGVVTNPIRFSGYSMLKMLNQSSGKNNYEAIHEWGQRMADTTITSKRVIFFAARKRYADDTIHVFASFKRLGASALDGSERSESFEVELAEWVLDNINLGFTYTEDFAAYKKLTRPIAKGVFDYLHVWFSASDKPFIRKDYQELCKFFEIACYKYKSQIEKKFGPALDELKSIGYLSKWEILPLGSKDGFMVVMFAGEELLKIVDLSGKKRLPAPKGTISNVQAELTTEQERALQSLIKEGVGESKALDLALKYEPHHIEDVIDYVGFIVQQDKTNRRRIYNPSGLLISHIENNVAVPNDFLTNRKLKERKEKQGKVDADGDRLSEEWQRYTQWRNEQARKEITARFNEEQLDQRLKKLVQTQVLKKWSGAQGWPSELRRNTAMGLLVTEILDELYLPNFTEWSEQHPQRELFS